MTDTEREALCARIDELCAEVEALKRDEWSAGFSAGCDAVEAAYEDGKAHYETENAKLREQVERLRTQLAEMTESVGRVEERCAKTFEVGKRWMAKAARFEAENTKLRELARDMWEGYNDPRCEECHLKDTPTCADCPICAREASVIDRMRELGVDA